MTDQPSTDPRGDAASLRSWPVVAIFAIAALYPIVLCLAAFPTPYIDIREHASWGQAMPLATWKHPPLQSWVTGLVAMLGAQDAWGYMTVAQVFNLATVWFCYRLAKEFIREDAGVPVAILIGGSAYVAGAMPTLALNADQIQPAFWAGMIYFALRAARDNRWRDWIAFGLCLALALYTKYYALVLVAALLAGAALVPPYRHVFANPRLYAAGLLALLLLIPHFVALTDYPSLFSFSATNFQRDTSRLRGIGDFIGPSLLIASPVALLALLPWTRRHVTMADRRSAPVRLLLVAAATFGLIMLAMILAGLDYSPRYSFGSAVLSAVVLVCLVRVAAQAIPALATIFLLGWAVVVPATAVYAVSVLRPSLREPAPAAAGRILQQWDERYRCGPAYIIGTGDAAFAVALYAGTPGRRFMAISHEDYIHSIHWFDRARIAREGAVLVDHDAATLKRLFDREFPDHGPVETFSLPYRRVSSAARQPYAYAYAFIAPKGC